MKLFTTCVNYGDFLAETLAEWQRFGTVHVITTALDTKTHAVACARSAKLMITERWFENSPTGINKGAAQQYVISSIVNNGDHIALFDADCFPVGNIPRPSSTNDIVGCMRFDCIDKAEFYTAKDHVQRGQPHYLDPVRLSQYRPELIRGYFQTFFYSDDLKFGRKRDTTFSGCDLYLASHFAHNTYVDPKIFHVLHLGERKKNWQGRVTQEWK